ncbi:MAG: putative 4-hydroxybenzoate polyprenyltransferase [Fimbriimonadaceae bacterium]|jgi:4-hydroxybenzoate polyprenyltransferase|nr:putative 4-hydroxybenzoate polyprenyltransferase [Fimbriimonadaceae bacterium]
MSTTAKGWQAFLVYLEMIKIEHSIFALPFAMVGMMWGSFSLTGNPWPGLIPFSLIVVAMVSCRSAAMAYNRIADRDIDSLNARTRMRAIPAGLLSLSQANLFFYGSVVVFLATAALLNPLTLLLSPLALLVTLGYSRTKRFTPLCHFVLGLSLAIAPAASWIAVTGRLDWPILLAVGAVLFWTAGFDIIYSLQDEEFDGANRLRSLPQTLGKSKALLVSRLCHLVTIGFLAAFCLSVGAGWPSWFGVAVVTAVLSYEQSLVKPNDLSKVNLAFFTLNGIVSLSFFAFVLLDFWLVPR